MKPKHSMFVTWLGLKYTSSSYEATLIYTRHNSLSLWNKSHGKRFIPVSHNKVMDLETQIKQIDNSNSVLFSEQSFFTQVW